jgi:hypothetical protein
LCIVQADVALVIALIAKFNDERTMLLSFLPRKAPDSTPNGCLWPNLANGMTDAKRRDGLSTSYAG